MKRNFNVEKYSGRKTVITKEVKLSTTELNSSRRVTDSDRNKVRHSFNNDR